MKLRAAFLISIFLLSVSLCGQVTIIGHNKLNNEPLKNTIITVKEDGVTTKTLDTKASHNFMLALSYGKTYRIFFRNARSPVMFMDVITSNIPEEKHAYKMTHELNVPFFDKNDDDVDTSVFREPFQRLIFDGSSKLVDDSAYSSLFRHKIMKVPETPEKGARRSLEALVIIAAKVVVINEPKQSSYTKSIHLINKKGQVIKSTATNRFGAFVFTGVLASDVAKIRMELRELGTTTGFYSLVNMAGNSLAPQQPQAKVCEWTLSPEDLEKLIDEHYTTNIGGKLVISSPKQKKFLANKTVYLCNKFNTILKQTTSNQLGSFVFEDIKPGGLYYIGVNRQDLLANERVDVLNKDEKFVTTLDTLLGGRQSSKLSATFNKKFNDLSISDDEMTMSVNATIYGDNINNPIGKLKVLLLNDNYQVIDSALTDDLGAFRFKYLPFLKRFYLSAENDRNMLDVFSNILIYNKDYNLVKIMTHEKGNKLSYKPVSAEIFRLREVEMEDPWLELMSNKTAKSSTPVKKIIIENILFESNSHTIKPQAKDILDKVVMVLQANKHLKIEIGAHTDSKGSDESNLELSNLRAKSVLSYIAAAGIDAKRVVCKGYGESKLLNDCINDKPCTEQEHARNRRIEFTILEEPTK